MLYFCIILLHSDLDLLTISLFILLISSGVKGLQGGVSLFFSQKTNQTNSMPKMISNGIDYPFSIVEHNLSFGCSKDAIETFFATGCEIRSTIDFLHLLEHFP